MTSESIPSLLRSLRRRSGLSQKELAQILGFSSEVSVANHERSMSVPHLLTALGYEAVFHVPASEIFPGFYQTVQAGIEVRLADMEDVLSESTAKGRKGAVTARKLEFLCERRNPELS